MRVRLVEVGCRGFEATSTSRLLREMGVQGKAYQQAFKELSRAAEKGVSGCGRRERTPPGPSIELMASRR